MTTYKNKRIKLKILGWVFSFLAVFLLSPNGTAPSTLGLGRTAHAQNLDLMTNFCKPANTVFGKIAEAIKSLDIRQTSINYISSVITDALAYILTGGTSNMIFSCASYGIDGGQSLLGATGVPTPDGCVPEDPDFCPHIFNTYSDDQSDLAAIGLGGGSLVAVMNAAERGTKEPLPVNFAYYIHKQVESVPFVGTTYAQAFNSPFNGPFLSQVYSMWEVVRDIAYAIIAVIMVIIGMMIMMRKKVNTQSIVTIQYAIPRIIIALVLITFSYALGSFMAGLSWEFRNAVGQAFYDQALGLTGLPIAILTSGVFVVDLLILIAVAATTGIGLFMVGFSILAMLMTVVIYLIVLVKWILVYIGILGMIITAPLTFAFGAIPGNDNQTLDWFKKVLVKFATIMGMKAIIALTNVFVISLTLGIIAGGGADNFLTDLGNSALIILFVIPFIYAYGYYQAMKLPGRLESIFLGKKPR